jgi:hypothetical protein
LANFKTLVSVSIQISDFDCVKFDFGRETELKKKRLRSFSICVRVKLDRCNKGDGNLQLTFIVQSSFGETQPKG